MISSHITNKEVSKRNYDILWITWLQQYHIGYIIHGK